jgi:hypothetical protein
MYHAKYDTDYGGLSLNMSTMSLSLSLSLSALFKKSCGEYCIIRIHALVLFSRVDDSSDHSMQHPSRPLPVRYVL